MHSQDQTDNLYVHDDELDWRSVKTDHYIIKWTCYCTEQRTGHAAVVDEEENEKRSLAKRVAGNRNEKTALRGSDWGKFGSLSGLRSIFITTTVRYHTDNKNINEKKQSRNRGFTLKPHVLNLGGGQ
ncbi:hypothetical protein [Haloarcula laminariae]|uniref:hypothetical protein n=1 Tax=Haloarcula laminariae TaxID=2961577 RepID=UPI0021C6E11F|nr:hypothetical protein [Halomicroarcula laminariae]